MFTTSAIVIVTVSVNVNESVRENAKEKPVDDRGAEAVIAEIAIVTDLTIVDIMNGGNNQPKSEKYDPVTKQDDCDLSNFKSYGFLLIMSRLNSGCSNVL